MEALPKVWVYELPDELIARHTSRSSGQNVLQEVMFRALSESPHRASSPEAASFFYVPIAFHWGGRGRESVAAVLGHIRSTLPFFNSSLHKASPDHLIMYTGDLAMDLPHLRTDPVLPPEMDASSPSRHFVALTLTGNPEVGSA